MKRIKTKTTVMSRFSKMSQTQGTCTIESSGSTSMLRIMTQLLSKSKRNISLLFVWCMSSQQLYVSSKGEGLLEDQGPPDHHDGVGGPLLFGRAFSTYKKDFTSNPQLPDVTGWRSRPSPSPMTISTLLAPTHSSLVRPGSSLVLAQDPRNPLLWCKKPISYLVVADNTFVTLIHIDSICFSALTHT